MQENRILAQADGERLNTQHWLLGGIGLLATLGMAAAIACAKIRDRLAAKAAAMLGELTVVDGQCQRPADPDDHRVRLYCASLCRT